MYTLNFFSSMMAGYAAMSFGILKLLWLKYGVHFYVSGESHVSHAPPFFDISAALLLIIFGFQLVRNKTIIPSLLVVMCICIYEFAFLHPGDHSVVQISLYVAIVAGQIFTLNLNAVVFLFEKGVFPVNGRS